MPCEGDLLSTGISFTAFEDLLKVTFRHEVQKWFTTATPVDDHESQTPRVPPALTEVMNNRTGGGVQLPLHQSVLRPQLQHLGVKEVSERRPAVAFVQLEDHRQLKGRRDGLIREEAARRL